MTETAGNELRAAKEASGKSYRQIAQEIGTGYALIQKIIERGEYASLETLYKICRTIGIEDKAYKVYQEREKDKGTEKLKKRIEDFKLLLACYEGQDKRDVLEDMQAFIERLESGL